MVPKDKYTIFDKKEKTYRKGIHSMCRDSIVCRDADGVRRTAEVDTSEPASQPSGFLNRLSITFFDCWAKAATVVATNAYRAPLYDTHHKTLAGLFFRRRGDTG